MYLEVIRSRPTAYNKVRLLYPGFLDPSNVCHQGVIQMIKAHFHIGNIRVIIFLKFGHFIPARYHLFVNLAILYSALRSPTLFHLSCLEIISFLISKLISFLTLFCRLLAEIILQNN